MKPLPFISIVILVSAATFALAQVPSSNQSPRTASKPVPSLFLIGDSTVNTPTKGQQGWGGPIATLFDTNKINVLNKARGGRSSRTYYTEGLWDEVRKQL